MMLKGAYMTLTKKDVLKLVDKNRKSAITDVLVDKLNTIINTTDEEEVREAIVDNFLTYGNVLTSGKFPIEKYLNAVRFVSYKMLNMTNLEAYRHTFPDRYKNYLDKYVSEGFSEKDAESRMGSSVNAVAHGKLVSDILIQVQIPSKILNYGRLQEAVNVATGLMYTSRSDMVKLQAAKTLIEYLGTNDDGMSIPINVDKRGDAVDKYEALFKRLAEEKLALMVKGGNVQKIANATVIEVEVDE